MTFIAALRYDRVEAPWVIDEPINAQAFRVYVETELIKTLEPGDIVILDNLGSHQGQPSATSSGQGSSSCRPTAQTSIQSRSCSAKLKHCMRRAAKRSVEAVHNAIANTLDDVMRRSL